MVLIVQSFSEIEFNNRFLNFQFIAETALKSTSLATQETVCTPSNLIICLPLRFFVIRQQPVEDGQCSRRDWTALLISTLIGATTNMALVIWVVNFGSDWTRLTAWPQIITTCCVWTWKTLKEILVMPSITCLVWWVKMTSTSWSSDLTQVIDFFWRLVSFCL